MSTHSVKELLPELHQIEAIVKQNRDVLTSEVLCKISDNQQTLPIYVLKLETTRRNAPCISYVGGIHGLERIGTQVVLSFLETLLERMKWDKVFEDILNRVRIIFYR